MSANSMEERRRNLDAGVDRLRVAVGAANAAVTDGWQQVAEDVSDLQGVLVRPVDEAQGGRTAKLDPRAYEELVAAVVGSVERQVRPGRTVLVVSRGDDQLLTAPGRRSEHFPQARDGAYAGHHPANSEAALEHLEQRRRAGAEYLAFPSTSFWWFDHYTDLTRYLDTRAWRIWNDQHCAIYRLPAERRRLSWRWSRAQRRADGRVGERR